MARQMIDYGRDGNGNWLVAGGDFVRAECTAKHQKDLILRNTGEMKQNPTIGVGAVNYVDGTNLSQFMSAISVQYRQDGMDVQEISAGAVVDLLEANVQVDAYYK